ncbi:Two-component sensor histidine kinase, contains HisKA and HATPase domains [Poseidonocella pacifica]|uniref:histidine kinase n=1 Tax=Poseidonocella pacifica TaxID=871651 RepID=A0A1I0XSB4_9RHOB|nr:HWE histidine kinase domain-containing protein [Poseidonocella pacifica]SFB04029.1 Two-component sensor histidine kinase, contains HisKA and HATPase domains [Poseidonocella pacifica]
MAGPGAFPTESPADHEDGLNDEARLSALRSSRLMESLPEEAFDRAVRLATRITGSPVALFSLVDDRRQFFKAKSGVPDPLTETGLNHSFCQYVVSSDKPLAVEDSRKHPLLSKLDVHPDLDVVAYLGVPVHGPEGQALGSFCAIDTEPHRWSKDELDALRDMAATIESEIALRQALKERQLLVEELNHRVKNLFAVISGMISLSLRGEQDVKAVSTTLLSRIKALSQAHELIVPLVNADRSQGVEVTIQKLVTTLIEPHLDVDVERVTIDGAPLMLAPRAATNLALALHELATNAAKYGALSVPEGKLEIRWEIVGDDLRLLWRETGVPTRTKTPSPSGFGSRLIDISIRAQLSGAIETEYLPTGMERRITIPLSEIKAPERLGASARAG